MSDTKITSFPSVSTNWISVIDSAVQCPELKSLLPSVREEYNNHVCYPNWEYLFNAFNHFDVEDTKVVILGQDPYINLGQAHGLSFSVPIGEKLPPSLRNIFKELESDLGCMPFTGELTEWAKQGVLLLNSTLTVRHGESNSHSHLGWNIFTAKVLKHLSETTKNVVSMGWGGFAQKVLSKLVEESNLFIFSPHPSPLSSYRGFFGSKPFSKANEYLKSHGRKPVIWCA